MSRKDYIRVAAILAGEHAIAQYELGRDAVRVVENITASIADVFAQDNPRFDRERFYTAALGRTTVR